jgi:hypothetical protein
MQVITVVTQGVYYATYPFPGLIVTSLTPGEILTAVSSPLYPHLFPLWIMKDMIQSSTYVVYMGTVVILGSGNCFTALGWKSTGGYCGSINVVPLIPKNWESRLILILGYKYLRQLP